jgi:uncharacterized protein YxjI
MSKFCAKCGDPLEPGQKFCEKCGAVVEGAANPVPSTQQEASGGLFDPSRQYYILQEKYWSWGSGSIMDEKGQEIGKMHRKVFSIRQRIELVELDGTVSAMIHKKIVAIRPTYDLKDGQERDLARLKKTIINVIKPKLFLEDPNGKVLYEARGKFMGWDFTITDANTGALVATVSKTDRWRDVFLGGVFNFKDTYALKIEDPSTDRRLLLGFVLSIDNSLHDQGKTGGFRFGR